MPRVLFLLLPVAVAGCGSSSSSDGSKGGDTCHIDVSLTGGIAASVTEASQACVTSSSSVAFAGLESKTSVSMAIGKLRAGQTGMFDATMGASQNRERWDGARCTVTIEANEPYDSGYDSGIGPEQRIRGSGSCKTPATYQGDAGAKDPVQIGTFTFVFTTHLY